MSRRRHPAARTGGHHAQAHRHPARHSRGAAKREDGSILPLPRKVKLEDEAAARLFKTLIKRKLAAERPATGSEVQLARDPTASAWHSPSPRPACGRSASKPRRGPRSQGARRSSGRRSQRLRPAEVHASRPRRERPDSRPCRRSEIGSGPAQSRPGDRDPAPAHGATIRTWRRPPAGRATPCGVSSQAP